MKARVARITHNVIRRHQLTEGLDQLESWEIDLHRISSCAMFGARLHPDGRVTRLAPARANKAWWHGL